MEHIRPALPAFDDLMSSFKANMDPRFRDLCNFAKDMVWVRDIGEGRLMEVNQATVDLLGYSRQELIGRPIYEFYFSDQDRDSGIRFGRLVETAGSSFMTVSFRSRTGNPLEVEMRGSLMNFEGGKAILVIARDIGTTTIQERRRAMTLYEAFKRSNDVMFYSDRNGVILDVNDAFTQHYGWTREEVLGKRPNILRSRHSTDAMYRRMWSSILEPRKGYWRGEIINKAKDGREIPLILTITAVKDAAGEIVGYISNAVDITEHVALQSRVAQAEALATLGEMAAVVAHEIRNPLSSIVMAAKHLADNSLAPGDRETVLAVLRTESQRLNETLTNFLAYARPRELRLEPSDLNALVSEVGKIVQSNHALAGKARIHVSLDLKLQPFPMDADQIRQVIWNIVINAVQAVDGKGKLTLATGRIPGHACFTVRDTGPGIPEDLKASIFKPFQTTKQQGTGLGLAIADRIVKTHGGRIEVESRSGEGAAFTVYLPRAED